jgi:hypothetical protein
MKRITSIIGANRLATAVALLLVLMVLGLGQSVATLTSQSGCYQSCDRPGGCTGDCPVCVYPHPDVTWCGIAK